MHTVEKQNFKGLGGARHRCRDAGSNRLDPIRVEVFPIAEPRAETWFRLIFFTKPFSKRILDL